MGPTLSGRDQIHIRLSRYFASLRKPLYGPIDSLGFASKARSKGLLGYNGIVDGGVGEIVRNAVLVKPFLLLALLLIIQRDAKSRAQNRLRSKRMDQAGHRKIGAVKERFIRQESNAGPGIALTALSSNGKIFNLIAVLEGHAVYIAIAADRDVEPLGQRVYHGHTYAVQTAAKLIVLIREFTAGVQRREDDLYTGLFLLRV